MIEYPTSESYAAIAGCDWKWGWGWLPPANDTLALSRLRQAPAHRLLTRLAEADEAV